MKIGVALMQTTNHSWFYKKCIAVSVMDNSIKRLEAFVTKYFLHKKRISS